MDFSFLSLISHLGQSEVALDADNLLGYPHHISKKAGRQQVQKFWISLGIKDNIHLELHVRGI